VVSPLNVTLAPLDAPAFRYVVNSPLPATRFSIDMTPFSKSTLLAFVGLTPVALILVHVATPLFLFRSPFVFVAM